MNFLDKPSTDFNAVRDGRRSMPLWLDIDLSTARSIAAGTAQAINIAGNSFYVDADTINVGTATLHFQDTNLGNSSAPMLAAPGFVANVPFTQILVENAAQAGKRLRIFYGVDIDFRAGVNASVISGTVTVSQVSKTIAPDCKVWTLNYKSTVSLSANTPDVVVAPGANVNGIEIIRAVYWQVTAGGVFSWVAKNGPPANATDGTVIDIGYGNSPGSKIETPIYVPPGLGLYAISNTAEGTTIRNMCYRLL